MLLTLRNVQAFKSRELFHAFDLHLCSVGNIGAIQCYQCWKAAIAKLSRSKTWPNTGEGAISTEVVTFCFSVWVSVASSSFPYSYPAAFYQTWLKSDEHTSTEYIVYDMEWTRASISIATCVTKNQGFCRKNFWARGLTFSEVFWTITSIIIYYILNRE